MGQVPQLLMTYEVQGSPRFSLPNTAPPSDFSPLELSFSASEIAPRRNSPPLPVIKVGGVVNQIRTGLGLGDAGADLWWRVGA